MLIVLDNFEQLTAAAGGHHGAPRGRARGCASWSPAGSPCTSAPSTSSPCRPWACHDRIRARHGCPVADSEAVQLFVDRARAVRPDFELDDTNAASVADICRRLDGLPLAIELAAARLRLFSPDALRDRLGSRLELLRSSGRDLPERQQTLRATIDWSYDLLASGEQRLFEALAVFSGVDLGAIEAVVGMVDATVAVDVDIVEALASLIEKNLVRQVAVAQGEPRFSMLETIREYATERLDQGAVAPLMREAHAIYFADLAARLRRELTGPKRDQAMATMAVEVENLRVAWRHWIAAADLARLTQLADSLLILNEARGWYQDTVALATGMLAVLAQTTSTPETVSQEVALRMTLARALMATQGYTPEVAQTYAKALELFEGRQDLRQHYSALRGLASLYLLRMEFDKAVDLGERILVIADAEGDTSMRIDGHLVVGSTAAFMGDLRGGLEHLDIAIDLFEAHPRPTTGGRQGNDPRVACLTTGAFILWLLGYPDRAVGRANHAIELARTLDHPYTAAYARFHAGLLHHWRGEPEIVLEHAMRLREIADEYEFRIWSAVGSCLLGAAQTNLGQVETGLDEIRQGMSAYQGMVSPPVFWPMLLFVEASARGHAGAPAEAMGPLDEAISLMGGRENGAVFIPEMLVLRGDLLRDLVTDGSQHATEAQTDYGSALAIARQLGARTSELRALTRLARSAGPDMASGWRAELQAAIDAFDDGLEAPDLVAARELLAAPLRV